MKSSAWVLVRRLPSFSAPLTIALVALVLLQVACAALVPLAMGRVVDAVSGGLPVVGALVLLGIVMFVDVVGEPLRVFAAVRLGSAVDAGTAQLTVEGALRPYTIGHLDRPENVDLVERARAIGIGEQLPSRAVTALANVAPFRLTGVASGVLLGWVGQWWMPIVVGAGWVVTERWREQTVKQAVVAQRGRTSALRRAAYLRDLALGRDSAKEVRLFGMTGWLVENFVRSWWDALAELRNGMPSLGRRVAGITVLAAAHVVVLVPVLLADTSPGTLTVLLQAVLGMAALGPAGDNLWHMHTASEAVPAAIEVNGWRADGPQGTTKATSLPQKEIRFEGVGFGYDRPVLEGLDLVIPAGSSLAIVGDNGAGKSTLTKLLAGLYRPDRGRITVDGHPLDDLDGWREQLAVVFQDFVRYPLTAKENIAFGQEAGEEALLRAARLGGFADTAAELPDGWDTPLSISYTGGTDLSGGQWQRLALSRALYAVQHGARVLVLDEPTAHLDIAAEHELYQRFLEITAGITTILVSHRFATVRLADRIVVLSGGRIIEAGTHDELIALGGRYARMFAAQSALFTSAVAEENRC